MDLKAILYRVEERLDALGLNARQASVAAGKPDAINNMRQGVKKGRTGVSLETLEALAPVLQTTVAWLAGETDEAPPTSASPQPSQPVTVSIDRVRRYVMAALRLVGTAEPDVVRLTELVIEGVSKLEDRPLSLGDESGQLLQDEIRDGKSRFRS